MTTYTDELKRIRSILSAATGLEDDDQEYIEDARKAVDVLIKQALEAPVPDLAHDQWDEWQDKHGLILEHDALNELRSMLATQTATCTWMQTTDPNMPDTFEATCGVVWTFTDGGPTDNNMKFCPKCGSKVVEGGAHEPV